MTTLSAITTSPADVDSGTAGNQQLLGALVTLSVSVTGTPPLLLKWWLSVNGGAEFLLSEDPTPTASLSRSITYQFPTAFTSNVYTFRAAIITAEGQPDIASQSLVINLSEISLPPVVAPPPIVALVNTASTFVDRKVILPPYLDEVDAWTDLADAISETFGPLIDGPTQLISQLRNLWIPDTQQGAMDKINNYQMLQQGDFVLYEREILIKQTNMLGFAFTETDLLFDSDYQNIGRNIALYWYSKGKPDQVDFLSFVLNNTIQVQTLWSTAYNFDQYGPFLPEGDPGIGTPVWEGGTWFPTTHVQITLDIGKFNVANIPKLTALFYAIANYNLVIQRIVLILSSYIHSVDEPQLARIVCAYPAYQVTYQIASPGFTVVLDTPIRVDANEAGNPSVGYQVTGILSTDFLIVSKDPASATLAWSYTPSDDYNLTLYPLTWTNRFCVLNNTTDTTYHCLQGVYLTAQAAFDAVKGKSATFTGGTSYSIYPDDATVPDNRGSMDLRVQVIRYN